MSESPQQPPKLPPDLRLPDGRPIPPNMQVLAIQLSELRYRQMLHFLFWHPKLALGILGVRSFLLPTILTVLFLCVFGGCGMAMSTVPEYGADIREATTFLLEKVGPVVYRNARFHWEDPLDGLPVTGELRHLRIDIVPRRDYHPDKPRQNTGIVVAHDGFRYWTRIDGEDEDAGETYYQDLPADTFRYLDQIQPPQGAPLTLDQKSQAKICKLIILFLFLSSFIAWSSAFGLIVVLAALGITIASILFRRGGPVGGLANRLSIGLNVCLPPLCCTIVYCLAEWKTSLPTLFGVMCVIYLFYIYFQGRNGVFLESRDDPS